jgi:hydrogenase maturation protease
MKVLVLGIGNTLLADEGVGVHVIESLRRTPLSALDDVDLVDGGTLSFTLAGPIQDADALIVVDAAQLKSPPGTIRIMLGDEMDHFLMSNRKSTVHEVGLTDLRAIAMLTGHWPEWRAMVAIQPQKLDWGEYPTDEVAAAIPVACGHIESLIESWRNGS